MSELKEGWKEAGKDVGRGFKSFGKTIFKSAKHVVNKVGENDEKTPKNPDETDIIDVDEANEPSGEAERVKVEKSKESNVFNDGSWRETGKGLGKGFKEMGQMLGKTMKQTFSGSSEENKEKPEESSKDK